MKAPTAPAIKLVAPLPAPLTEKDLIYVQYDKRDETTGQHGSIHLYYAERFGWCITTLHISNPSRRHAPGATPRTYGIAIKDGGVVRIGLGPHVKQDVTVYISKVRAKALKPIIDLYVKGMSDASEIRDLRSTRRARGTLRRASLSRWDL